VALLAPRYSIGLRSRYVDRKAVLRDEATLMAMAAALHAALHDPPSPTGAGLDAGEERIFVQFPGEWLRDPASPWLRKYPVDMPWDDPELLEAMLALRNET
jgi:hypothetical protein